MSMHKEDYVAKGKKLFDNFADDWKENIIVSLVAGAFGFLLKWTGWVF